MTNARVLSLLVIASTLLAAACSRTDTAPAQEAATAAKPAEQSSVAPAARPRVARTWSGRTESEHTWIAVSLQVDSPTSVSRFSFDSGCAGDEKSLVGWRPEGLVSAISPLGEFSFATDGMEAKGTFHGDDHVEGVIVDGIGFGFDCDGAANQAVPDKWRIAASD